MVDSSAQPSAARSDAPAPTASYSQDLDNARQSLAGLLQRLRKIRHGPAAHAPTGGVSSDEVVQRLSFGLQKEHQYVLTPLLGRLDALAQQVLQGANVPLSAIEEGLGLVDRYLHELHDAHLRLLEQAGVDASKGEPARLAYQQLASDYENARVRWATVRVMLHGYEEHTPAGRAMFALTLAQECRSEMAWHDFEEAYVKSSVPAQFPAKVVDTWRVELDHARDEGRADRARIEDWVNRTAALVPAAK